MKKILLLTSLLFAFEIIHAQEMLLGVTQEGGTYGRGTLFTMSADGSTLETNYSFQSIAGRSPQYSQLIEADGKLYGVTYQGGGYLKGVLFDFDPSTNQYHVLHNFDDANTGAYPYGSLVAGGNGKLYGMTAGGGVHNKGVLFEFDPVGKTVIKRFDFDGIRGSKPVGDMVRGANGKLYGVTSEGGSSNTGILFEFEPSTNIFQKKKDFVNSADGTGPFGGLSTQPNGKLLGMCAAGGTHSGGTIFEYDITTNLLTKLHDFDGSLNGKTPLGRLTLTEGGIFYGLTLAGGTSNVGILFQFDPTNGAFVKKVDFDAATKGSHPYGSLLYASNKRLYGVTEQGLNGYGGFFQYDLSNGNFSVVAVLDGLFVGKGASSRTTPMQASNGIIYGMTSRGGLAGDGVLFAYNPTSHVYEVKLSFNSGDDGDRPMGNVVQGMNGKLYGTTYLGGVNRSGTIFEFDITHGIYKKKIDLTQAAGAHPSGGLMRSASGKLYGLAKFGGNSGAGVLFEYDPATNEYIKKFDFSTDAANPLGVLVQHDNGTLFGVTENGGVNGNGVLFSYHLESGVFTKLVMFDGGEKGGKPTGTLLIDGDRLFGLAANGGTGNMGVLYRYELSVGEYSVLKNFVGSLTGAKPFGTLLAAADGKFYGLTQYGGLHDRGVIFEFGPGENAFQKRYDFHDVLSLGMDIQGSLAESSNGKLYGTTQQGGSENFGVIYEFDLTTNTFTKKHDLTGNNGARPQYGNLLFVSLQEQYITFDPLPDKTSHDTPFTLTAAATSGLPLSFDSSDPSVASISSNLVTIHKGGTVIITAKQEGSINFHAAEPVSQNQFVELIVNSEDPVDGDLHLYPNPASREFYLKLKRQSGDLRQVTAVDVLGRTVVIPAERVDREQSIYRCDISGLTNGLYQIITPDRARRMLIVR